MRKESGRVRRWPTIRSKRWTKQLLARAERDANVLAVVAVGSAVRPRVPSDDLDLLIVCRDPGALAFDAPLEVDVRSYAAFGIDRQVRAGDDLLGWAITYGVPIFQRSGFWNEVVSKLRGHVPLPSPQNSRARAAQARRRMMELLALGDQEAAAEQKTTYLTHLARAALARRGVYPASRPELPGQLMSVGCAGLASQLQNQLCPDVQRTSMRAV